MTINVRHSLSLLIVSSFLLGTALLHLFYIVPIGFMSDDYSLLVNAQKGERLWDLHYSLFLEFLWKQTASGTLTAFHWHVFVLMIHFCNVFILYLITQRLLLSPLQSLFICACFIMSPAGVEALAWTCSAGYVLTTFWIFMAWYYLLTWNQEEGPVFLKAAFLALLQIAAYLTWDWGGLLFPILTVFALNSGAYLRSLKLLAPLSICWLVGTFLRFISNYGLVWQQNDWMKKLQFLGGASFLGFFPNLNKELYQTWLGIFLVGAFAAFLLWAACRNKLALASMVCFIGTILPWVNGGNPSGRYFYLSMPFVYMAVTLGLSEIRKKSILVMIGGTLLILELSFTYKRDFLWNRAFHESQHLKEEVKEILETPSPLVIVNLPEAYGPEQMPMRPQMWYSGFNETFPEVNIARLKNCPYLWQKSAHLKMNRSDIPIIYPQSKLYEVVYRHKDQWSEFILVPFE